MKANIVKNTGFRRSFLKVELKKRLYKKLITRLYNITEHVGINKFFTRFFVKDHLTSYVTVKNKCILTGRSASVYKQHSISRMQFRNFVRYGFLPGYKKAVW